MSRCLRLQVAGLAHAARTRRPKGIHALLLPYGIWKRDTGRRPGSGSGKLSRRRDSWPIYLSIQVVGFGIRVRAATAGNDIPGTGQAPARARASLAAALCHEARVVYINIQG